MSKTYRWGLIIGKGVPGKLRQLGIANQIVDDSNSDFVVSEHRLNNDWDSKDKIKIDSFKYNQLEMVDFNNFSTFLIDFVVTIEQSG